MAVKFPSPHEAANAMRSDWSGKSDSYVRRMERARKLGRDADSAFRHKCWELKIDPIIAITAPLEYIVLAGYAGRVH